MATGRGGAAAARWSWGVMSVWQRTPTAPSEWPERPWYPAGPMSVTAEAPAQYRGAAVRPGPIGLLREAVTETFARRRLIGYLVQADIRKKGADTLLGNLWWVLDPLLQMAVYVVLVSVIFDRGKADYPIFIFAAILPWKWFQTTIYDGITLGHRRRFPDPAGPVPEACAAGRLDRRRGRQLHVRPDPADRADPAVLSRPPERHAPADPAHRRGAVLLQPGAGDRAGGAQRLLPRHRQRRPPRHAPLVLPLAGPLCPGRPAESHRGTCRCRSSSTCCCGIPSRSCSPPTATSSTRASRPIGAALGALLVASLILLALSTLLFKRAEPAFAKVL